MSSMGGMSFWRGGRRESGGGNWVLALRADWRGRQGRMGGATEFTTTRQPVESWSMARPTLVMAWAERAPTLWKYSWVRGRRGILMATINWSGRRLDWR